MNIRAINNILERITKDISKLQFEINKVKSKKPLFLKKNSKKPEVIECNDEYIKRIIKNGGL